jgi:hypothetical protein
MEFFIGALIGSCITLVAVICYTFFLTVKFLETPEGAQINLLSIGNTREPK